MRRRFGRWRAIGLPQQAALWVGAGLVPVAWTYPGLDLGPLGEWAVLSAAPIYGLQVLRGLAARGRSRFSAEVYGNNGCAALGRLVGPAVGLLHCWGLVRTLFGRRIVWRGITYELAGGQIRLVSRSAAAPGARRRRKAKRRPARIRRP